MEVAVELLTAFSRDPRIVVSFPFALARFDSLGETCHSGKEDEGEELHSSRKTRNGDVDDLEVAAKRFISITCV